MTHPAEQFMERFWRKLDDHVKWRLQERCYGAAMTLAAARRVYVIRLANESRLS